MLQDNRPNADALLSRIVSEEAKSRRGSLRLFFGMAAGVGKTYAMLKAGREALKDGVDVVVGILETHGRAETIQMAEGLPLLPRKQIEYRGILQEEMDLDAILARKPGLVLVDELAHSNVPGLRHEKRYQDVIDLLEAGIDVYSTMNVQHLESRADVVGLITAVQIRETVPDSILDRVDQIDLIDITPNELIDRLKEGKIYPGRKTEQALQYFFQEGNLSALREIVLRVTADKVERDMRGPGTKSRSSLSLSAQAKLAVAIGPSPFSEKLIRTARRIVEDLEMPWLVIYVDNGRVLSPEDQNQLVKNLDLAKEMGAETVTLHGAGIARTISEYIQGQHVVQLIVGRPSGSTRFIRELIRQNPDLDITILRQPQNSIHRSRFKISLSWDSRWLDHGIAVSATIGVTLLNFLLTPIIGYHAAGFLFWLLVVSLSIFLPFTAVFFSAFLSALIWNYFFIPPTGTFTIGAPEDAMLLITFFITACAGGILTRQVKNNQKILKDREEKTRELYDLLKSMTLVQGTGSLIEMALTKIESLFGGTAAVILAESDHILEDKPKYGKIEISENDLGVATWSFNHGRKAGWSTDTLPLSKVLCLTLKSGGNKFGVLVFRPKMDKKLSPDQVNLLISIANQIGMVLAKEHFDEEGRKSELMRESEKLHQTLLNCISHELRTPLTAIMGAATALQSEITSEKSDSSKQILSSEIVSASERLNHIFENLLDLTRLEAGALKLKQEWFDVLELVHYTVDRQKRLLGEHTVQIHCEKSAYINGDFELLGHALSNLLLNAANYSPPLSTIDVNITKTATEICVSIQDLGPGIPSHLLPHIFDKFYRLPGSPSGGLGLGLSITQNLIELHGGKVTASTRPEGGSIFSLLFTYQAPPQEIEDSQ